MTRVTIGGKRLGSGNKMQTDMHNYGRSTHNLSRTIRTSMAPGTLIPICVEPMINGDTFDIDMTMMMRTMPTLRPLYGTFKYQADTFFIPMRLYNRQLHNNKQGIGMHIENVKFPLMRLKAPNNIGITDDANQFQINPSSLIKYLGTSGLGYNQSQTASSMVVRDINAMPLLGYWDIYKNYYANKQEEIGMVISAQGEQVQPIIAVATLKVPGAEDTIVYGTSGAEDMLAQLTAFQPGTRLIFNGSNLNANQFQFEVYNSSAARRPMSRILTLKRNTKTIVEFEAMTPTPWSGSGRIFVYNDQNTLGFIPAITQFPLSNIDDMRESILSAPNEYPFLIRNRIKDNTPEPYFSAIGEYAAGGAETRMLSPMGGLGIKTYQSDRFNNWLSTEWIDGVNGIAEVSSVDTSSGSFNMDTLNLAQKVYNMLNRIAVSGGDWIDYQQAVWSTAKQGLAEIPMYCGGISGDINFSEILSTVATENSPLGDLGGVGNGKGGGSTIRVKAEEPGYLMIIASLTPYIDYSQGNKWFGEGLKTMADLHKPEMDAIGYQELITDEMAAWDTRVTVIQESTGDDLIGTPTYSSAGKQPAWIHYMTSQNECYGTFANKNEEMQMTLNRSYERDETTGKIMDLTTYIDPEKYNYAFAKTNLEAQNFWMQSRIRIQARRIMSAKIIPNL